MAFIISRNVLDKLATKHRVSVEEIEQCFASRTGTYLEDSREEHKTDPPTRWFIGETDMGRKLKVVFIQRDGETIIRTAYEANDDEKRIYATYSTPA